ncbi:MAG: hypothetical protein HY298_01250 [Verrucomicrobia bacterium]|nr:hypothetical protein [Verrucomicrobiota bacterium]
MNRLNGEMTCRQAGEQPDAPSHRSAIAFTLLEVMIAMGLFFMAVFSILALVSNGLRNARALQQTTVDAGMLAAELSLTNKLTEGTDSGDFGDLYPDYKWTQEITEVGTNGLFEVKFVIIHHTGGRYVESPMNILLFRPESTVGGIGGGLRR